MTGSPRRVEGLRKVRTARERATPGLYHAGITAGNGDLVFD